MRSVDVVANVVAEEGVTEVFGLMGDGNLNLITYLTEALKVPFHSSRHEAIAIGMADGYARVKGETAFCTVTQGPGLTNTITALVTARKARTPMVLYVGDVPPSQAGWPQDLDHHRLLESIDIPVINLVDPKTVHDDVRLAFARARAERRPIVLNQPIDQQKAEWEPWDDDIEIERKDDDALIPLEPSQEQLDALVALLESSSRPLIVAGKGARGARDALVRLGDHVGALMATTLPARGLFADLPTDLGVVGSLASNLGASLIGRADLVLAFGASLNDFTTIKRTIFAESATVVRIDLEPTNDRPNRLPADLEVIADSAVAAMALIAAAPSGLVRFRTEENLKSIGDFSIDEEFADRSDDEGLDPRTLMRALERVLPSSRTIVSDVGHFFGFPVSYMDSEPGDQFIATVDFGAVGTGLGVAIGASIAEPDKLTVAFVGDGGLMMSLGDLDTAMRESKSMLIVVMNDSSYGSELHMLREWKLDVSTVVFPFVSFQAVAAALGVRSASVVDIADLPAALSTLPDSQSGPLLIDCKITTHVVADWLAGAFDH
jgi:thiamine pyrophosphate-dependent acetolactate synthase large subunit-like protein